MVFTTEDATRGMWASELNARKGSELTKATEFPTRWRSACCYRTARDRRHRSRALHRYAAGGLEALRWTGSRMFWKVGITGFSGTATDGSRFVGVCISCSPLKSTGPGRGRIATVP